MKIGCVIYSDHISYKDLHDCAVKSFMRFHPDILLYSIDFENHDTVLHQLGEMYDDESFATFMQTFGSLSPGVRKYTISHLIAKCYELDKLIILGSDTITCSRLNEFLEGTEDILATLDYPYQFDSMGVQSPDDQTHVNADVICFNNLDALEDICKAAMHHHVYHEQGGLNEILWSDRYQYTYSIVDHPYHDSAVVYNARAKGNVIAGPGEKPWAKYTSQFTVKDHKLFTGTDPIPKQIRVWHYCDGFYSVGPGRMGELIQWWKTVGFNNETKRFFAEDCDCNFFDE